MKKLLLFVFSLLLSHVAFAGFTPTEAYLTHGHEYRFADSHHIDRELFILLKQAEARVKKLLTRDYPEAKRDLDYLLIGDTYHWLGHIADDVEDFDKAELYFKKAKEAYAKTSITNSVRINNLNGIEHADWHLQNTKDLIEKTPEERRRERAQFMSEYGIPHAAAQVYYAPPEYTRMQSVNVRLMCMLYLQGEVE